ncbi:undecaprenyl-diphosphatase [Gracilibacillus orientalis]|uniref:Undecaprenyl-diphosphatase n=1 Tax=Gracilibacillus orientalis TaxID=334253 RepID=A0A1I4IT74_9BACI|nr:phosphatase PAP2 family protein [Gracilibacillus orientalis]SFL57041.1 undecaprenyl-diphosphatase [Gracilibacillus orientalis]
MKDMSKIAIVTLIVGFIIIILTMSLFIELAGDVLEEEKFFADRIFQENIVFAEETWIHQMMEVVTEAGSVIFLTIASVILAVYLFFAKKSKWYSLFFSINMVGISLLTQVLKVIFERERPELIAQYGGTGFSFPSGHSTGSIAFYGFIMYLLWKKVSAKWLKWLSVLFFACLAIVIAFSRVVLGVHFFTDIVAGMSLGLAWLITCMIALEFFLWRGRKKRNS